MSNYSMGAMFQPHCVKFDLFTLLVINAHHILIVMARMVTIGQRKKLMNY